MKSLLALALLCLAVTVWLCDAYSVDIQGQPDPVYAGDDIVVDYSGFSGPDDDDTFAVLYNYLFPIHCMKTPISLSETSVVIPITWFSGVRQARLKIISFNPINGTETLMALYPHTFSILPEP